jgi:hypothetical protein
MLSHGGSWLNASKPEANPKTRYPQKTHTVVKEISNRHSMEYDSVGKQAQSM